MSELRKINNYFGDMDLFLMDLILKGKIEPGMTILDAGCGEGRNAVYFIREGYSYTGIDTDESKIQLAQYMANNISTSKATFSVSAIDEWGGGPYDLVICSRVLHFSESESDFFDRWNKLALLTKTGGLLFVSMDSVIDTTLGKSVSDGLYEFPDGAVRFSMTPKIYSSILNGFEEVEPLRTLAQHKTRSQSFFTLRKV